MKQILGLPAHWKTTTIGGINCYKQQSIDPRKFDDEVFEYYSIPAFQERGLPTDEVGAAIGSSKLLVGNRVVLFGKLNPRVLKVWLTNREGDLRKIASTEFIPIEATADAHTEYLYYLCHSGLVVGEAKKHVSGSTPSRQRVKPKAFERINIPLPPLPEQQAIARALRAVQDARDTRLRELELERERKAALMEHLFAHGTRGEPTKMTEIGEVPESWGVGALMDVADGGPRNGAFVKKPIWGSGVPFANVADLYAHPVLDLGSVERLECDAGTLSTYGLNRGDLLFVRSSLKREGIAQCCVVGEIIEPSIFDCHIIRVVPDQSVVVPLYAASYFLTQRGRADLVARSKTTTMTTINQKSLMVSQLPIAPLEEQRQVALAATAIENKMQSLQREIGVVDELFRAMLEELMTGRLSVVPLIGKAGVTD